MKRIKGKRPFQNSIASGASEPISRRWYQFRYALRASLHDTAHRSLRNNEKILREALPSVIAALIVAVTLAVWSDARKLTISALTYEFTSEVYIAIIVTALSVVLGVLVTLRVLRETLRLGITDTMTQTLRENQIDPYLEKRTSEAKDGNSYFSVLLVDIDNFKRINDEFSHEIGNHTLSELAGVITPRGKTEEIFRYGGDEFLIVTELGVGARECWGYAKRIVKAVADHDFEGQVNSPKQISLTISCGCLICSGSENTKTIREQVDSALKKAKQPNPESPSGKNSAYVLKSGSEPVEIANT